MHGPRDTRTPDELAKLGYEREDIALRTIAIWVFGFFVFTVFAGVATAVIYNFIVPSGFMPAKTEARTRFPAEPRLQDDIRAKTDIYELRAREERGLASSGPAPDGGRRIPIEDAMSQVAGRYGVRAPSVARSTSLNPGPNAYNQESQTEAEKGNE